MAIVVGIDEAGYGPLLGPLVVGASLWRVPSAQAEADFWECLREVLCRKPSRSEWRLVVNDSKKVYDRKQGLAGLERPVLAFNAAAGHAAKTVAGLLGVLNDGAHGFGDGPPWYRKLHQRLPRDREKAAYEAIAARLTRCMEQTGVRCVGLMAEIVPEDLYNRRLAQTNNKAAIVVEQVLRLVTRATALAEDQDVWIHVDRLGGRQNYGPLLREAFSERHLHVLEHGESRSRYRLATQTSDWHIDFRIDADQHVLPVALASMVAKYVRELLMERFNEYWRRLAPNIRPTAGYYRDAKRFIQEIEPLVARAGLERREFIRRF